MLYLGALLVVLGWLSFTPQGLLGKADAIGYAVCHRIDLRSFHLGDRQLPLCARCSGMYLGAVLGLVYQFVYARRRSGFPVRSVIAVLAVLLFAFGIDGLNSYLHFFPNAPTLYQPDNLLRLLTGTGMGLVIAAGLYPAFNQTVWQEWDSQPALDSIKSLGVLLVLAAGLDVLILGENPLLLYPLAIISALGVVLILSMVYGMVWLMVLRAENRITRLYQLLPPMVGGLTLAILQIALIDLGRFLLTGTWDGFHFG